MQQKGLPKWLSHFTGIFFLYRVQNLFMLGKETATKPSKAGARRAPPREEPPSPVQHTGTKALGRENTR